MTMFVKSKHYSSTLNLMNNVLQDEKKYIKSIYIKRFNQTYQIKLITKNKTGIAYLPKDFMKYFFKTKEKIPTLKIFFQNILWEQNKF